MPEWFRRGHVDELVTDASDEIWSRSIPIEFVQAFTSSALLLFAYEEPLLQVDRLLDPGAI